MGCSNNNRPNITYSNYLTNYQAITSNESNNIDMFSFNKAIINCLIRINCLIHHFQSNKLSYLQIQENDEKKKIIMGFHTNFKR